MDKITLYNYWLLMQTVKNPEKLILNSFLYILIPLGNNKQTGNDSQLFKLKGQHLILI